MHATGDYLSDSTWRENAEWPNTERDSLAEDGPTPAGQKLEPLLSGFQDKSSLDVNLPSGMRVASPETQRA